MDFNAARVETIHGLRRGLRVLKFLQSQPIASLHEIYIATRISKPSLLRVLNTLMAEGWVSRRLADGRYRLNASGGVVRKGDRYDRVAEAAAPVLFRLCEKVKWPSVLFVPAADYMEGRETSRPLNPFVVRTVQGSIIRARISWLMTGTGRDYLAWCPEKERERILQRLRKSDKPCYRLARDPKRLARILGETRRRGYGVRDPGSVGGRYGDPPQDDGLAGIAMALRDGPRVHGAINILWIKTAFTVDEFATRHLADLQAAALEIVSSLRYPDRGFIQQPPTSSRSRRSPRAAIVRPKTSSRSRPRVQRDCSPASSEGRELGSHPFVMTRHTNKRTWL